MPRVITPELEKKIKAFARLEGAGDACPYVIELLYELQAEREVSDELLRALDTLSLHVERMARESYLEDQDADPELFELAYEDADHEQWELWHNARKVIAKTKDVLERNK